MNNKSSSHDNNNISGYKPVL